MKPIPTKVHGLLDYTTGALFIASPWLLNFADNSAARRVAVGTGVAVLGLSALTDYEVGIVKRVPMATHLAVDKANGVLVAASPWLFGFAKRICWPHLAFGLLELGAGLLTQRKPSYEY
ncbi:SPW repeat domain-containing protein [Spirosoma sp.]|uniref:SPW repeat domain-containing protein n=1 Tax=Spirosoma sp. TaxID=1899569 RepID=UPI003B3B88BC